MAEKDKKAPELQEEELQEEERRSAPDKAVKKDAAAKPAGKKAGKPGLAARTAKWFHELKSEIKKVVWPTFNQVLKNTLIVLVTIAVVGLFIWVFDFLISQGNLALSNLFS